MNVLRVTRKLPGLLADDANSYAGADLLNAVRLVAMLAALSALLTVAYFAFEPPIGPLGVAGWAIAGALVASGLVGAGRLLRREPPPGFNALLLVNYLGLGAVALLVWLSGGVGSPYGNVYLLWILAAVGVHPPRRGLTFLAA